MNNTPNMGISSSDAAGDHALALAANRGDALAFEILVKRYEPKLMAIALVFTRVREDAEDIVQQSFRKAFIHLREFEGKSSFFTWLTRIAVNEALMLLLRKRRAREVSMDVVQRLNMGELSHSLAGRNQP